LQFSAETIKDLNQLSICCGQRSRSKLIHLQLNDYLNCQCRCSIPLILLMMQDEQLLTLNFKSFQRACDCMVCWKWLSCFDEVQVHLAMIMGIWGWCGMNCVTAAWRHWEVQRIWSDVRSIIWFDGQVVWGIVTLDDVAWLDWYRLLLVVCNVMGSDSDSSLEHEEWFKGSRHIVFKESVVGTGGFRFLLSLLVLLNSNASCDFETASTIVLSWFPQKDNGFCCLIFWSQIIVMNITYIRPRPLQWQPIKQPKTMMHQS
jgi:hypothetical protein